MNWKFEQDEISNGQYSLRGLRDTGNNVSLQADESEFYRIYEEAFNLEVSLGTLPGKALFAVISGARKAWLGEYNDDAFGSWQVASPDGTSRYVYDGKDCILLYYSNAQNPDWRYRINDGVDINREIFLSLV